MFPKKFIHFTIVLSLLAGLFTGLLPQTASAANTYYSQLFDMDTYFVLDDSKADEGYITIQANKKSTETYKVVVSNEDERYIYDFSEIKHRYPLQLGDGEYFIQVYKKLGEKGYIALHQWRTEVKIKHENSVYLIQHQLLNWEDNSEVILEAKKLVKGLKTDQDKALAIYSYIVDNFKYDDQIAATLKSGYIPDPDRILENKEGICYDFSALYAIMLRSVQIPAKLVMGTTENVNGYHAWNEVLLNDKWVVIDTSYDVQAKAAKAKYAMIKTNTYSKEKEF